MSLEYPVVPESKEVLKNKQIPKAKHWWGYGIGVSWKSYQWPKLENLKKFSFINLLIFGCAESSLLQGLLSGCSECGLLSSCSMRASHCGGLSCGGEGNGTPLQYSCLENPMDGGAWWAALHGVVKSWTLLKWLSSSGSSCGAQALGCEAQELQHMDSVVVAPGL